MRKINDIIEGLIAYFNSEEETQTAAVDKEKEPELELPMEKEVPSQFSRSRKKTSQKPFPKHRFRRFWRRYHLTKILMILVLTFSLVVGGYLFLLAKSSNVKDLENALKATTVIVDKDGAEAGSLSGQKGTYVELNAISKDLQDAVIATEDRSFYKNSGVNYGRFFLAILTGGRSGGGSTITQQLAKNAYLSQEQTIKRKAKEFFLALELTKKYSKEQILTMYLNNAYFGNGVWGVEDASKKYFGVSANELSQGEAATLAGMLKGPEIYNPLYSIENATNRRNTVLQNMVASGYIDQATADKDATENLADQLQDTYQGRKENYPYPSYFDAVINEAIHDYGLSEEEIVNNGYRIYTELDQNSQANMQVIYDNTELFPVAEDGTQAQGASVALDPKTGGVRSLVGRVNSDVDAGFRTFNYATQSNRSPGSTIKPLVVYSPAVAAGWSIDKELDNTTTTYPGYTVNNYADIQGAATIPMYQALANSLNIPAVATVNELGIEKAFEYGKKFGLQMDQVDKTLGVALGSGVSTNPLQMAQAYSTFANGGVMNKAHLITKIENASGQVVKNYQTSRTRVLNTTVADKMTSMMLGTFSNGTGIYAAPANYIMAGKTGTTETNFNADLTGDQWVIGYTPDLVISQWLGFSTTDESHYLTGTSANEASVIFKATANAILPYTAGTQFTDEKNAYAENGIAPIDLTNGGGLSHTDQTSSTDFLDNIKKQASDLVEQAKDVISQAPEKAQNLWDKIRGFFN